VFRRAGRAPEGMVRHPVGEIPMSAHINQAGYVLPRRAGCPGRSPVRLPTALLAFTDVRLRPPHRQFLRAALGLLRQAAHAIKTGESTKAPRRFVSNAQRTSAVIRARYMQAGNPEN